MLRNELKECPLQENLDNVRKALAQKTRDLGLDAPGLLKTAASSLERLAQELDKPERREAPARDVAAQEAPSFKPWKTWHYVAAVSLVGVALGLAAWDWPAHQASAALVAAHTPAATPMTAKKLAADVAGVGIKAILYSLF